MADAELKFKDLLYILTELGIGLPEAFENLVWDVEQLFKTTPNLSQVKVTIKINRE